MGLIFDDKLELILRHNEIEVLGETELNNNMESIIIDALTKKCGDKVCALWGAGQNNTKSSHAAILITKYATFMQNMVCVIDSNPELQGKKFLGYPIISPSQLEEYNINLVIIASKNSGESIKKNLFEIDNSCAYLDIYEELKKRNIQVYNNFYDENSIYSMIYKEQKMFEKEKSEKSLVYLITYYYSIRDFYYAFYYTDIYCLNFYKKRDMLSTVKNEVTELINSMIRFNREKENDISLFYIDALRAQEVISNTEQQNYFQKYKKNGLVFTNMYSTAVTTYESMMSVITGKYPLEVEVYSNDFLHEKEEFELLSVYEGKEYDINFLISECYKVIQDSKNINFYYQNYMTLKLWTLSCILAESKKNTFNFLYFPYEIHFPLLCGFHTVEPVIRAFSDLGINEFPPSMSQQYIECLEYADKQFEFYYDLLGGKTNKIIFSDHSQVVYDKYNNGKTFNMYYKDKELTTHVPLIISKENSFAMTENEFFSMVDFNAIIINVLEKKQYETFRRKIVRYQYYPMHNPKMREHAMKNRFENYIDGMDVFLSEEFICVITATGKCEIYKNDNLSENIFLSLEGEVILSKIRKSYSPVYKINKDNGEKNE